MNISVIEFIVYGLIAYTSMVVLIISASRDAPMVKTKSGTLIKSMYMIPGIICCILLAGSGVAITLNDSTVVTMDYTINGTTGAKLTNSTITTTSSDQFTLENPVWVSLHYLFALILTAYVFTQVLRMLTSKD